jgi:hypothetical protein
MLRIVHTCVGLALLLEGACGGGATPHPPPPVPAAAPTVTFDVVACHELRQDGTCARPIAGARVRVNNHVDARIDVEQTTNQDGYAVFTLADVTGDASIFIAANGYQPYDSGTIHPKDLGGRHNVIRLEPNAASADGGERGFLHVAGVQFLDDRGRPWRYRGCSDFSLAWRFVHGENLDPILTDRIEAGCRVLRVFGMMENIAHFWPQQVPDYYGRIAEFVDKVASRGLRVEFVVFADARNKLDEPRSVMPQLADQQRHYARVVAALQHKWAILLELCNECEQNGVDPQAFRRPPPPLVASRGSSGGEQLPPMPPWSYTVRHGSRGPQWPRDAKGALDVRDGWQCSVEEAARGCVPFGGTHQPTVEDEPMGASETDQPGRRSNSPDDFAFFAGVAALMSAGATFHSDAGIRSERFGPIQRACAKAMFEGMGFVPADAQTRPYQRGAAAGGPGIGNMPLEHVDADGTRADGALRSFCRGDGASEWCVVVRPGPEWIARARDGWRIAEQPRRGFVRLVR